MSRPFDITSDTTLQRLARARGGEILKKTNDQCAAWLEHASTPKIKIGLLVQKVCNCKENMQTISAMPFRREFLYAFKDSQILCNRCEILFAVCQ